MEIIRNDSTTGRMVERLITAGLIDRRPPPALRRELVVELTRHGQELVHAVTAHRRGKSPGSYTTCLNASGTVWSLPSPHSLQLAVNPQPVSKSTVTWSDTTPFSDPARQVVACQESAASTSNPFRAAVAEPHRPTLLTGQRRISL
jgi:DNA-binding MarR family transcriptional regulator